MCYGLNVYSGEVVDMLKEGVIEPEYAVSRLSLPQKHYGLAY